MDTMQVDGVSLAYEEAGAGGPPLLFVHGWAGNRTNFAPQMAHFAGRHRVVTVDRRGHGASDAPEQEYTVESASDDLAAVCRQLGLSRAIVVQHSYDRLGYDFAAGHPELVLALAVLDGPTLAGGDWEVGCRGFLEALRTEHWQEAIRGFAEQAVFPAGMPEAFKEAAMAELLATPHHVLLSTWQHFLDYPTERALAGVGCPLLYVGGAFPADLDRLRELCPQVQVAEVRDAGHFIQLTAAGAVNAILADFVAEVSSTQSETRR